MKRSTKAHLTGLMAFSGVIAVYVVLKLIAAFL